jgi:Na+/H+ antiporter NhaD/arsenite permease-like protein
MITTSLVVSCLIFLLIALRQWLPASVRIWHIMTAGAVVLLLLGEISPRDAVLAVDWNVIAYLLGVFVIASALYDTGISHAIGARLAAMRRPSLALAGAISITSLCAAVLTNDAAAIIGTPIALMLAEARRWPVAPLLIALCATVTVSSMASPVGNPQNILIATTGHIQHPIATFALWLAVPTLASLVFVFYWARRLIGRPPAHALHPLATLRPAPTAGARPWPAYLATALLVVLIGAEGMLRAFGMGLGLPFGVASVVACVPVLAFGQRRLEVLKDADWATLVFFVAMFVVTGSIMQSGSLQALLGSMQARLAEPPVTAVVSFWASQLFSNVPVVDIYLKLLPYSETGNLMMLAGLSTLAGNLFIISAASNVIVVQQAERFGQTPFTFWRFAFAVLPVTLVSVGLTYAWVAWMSGHL